ncbi:MAG TPA: cytochrome c [Terriglobia bacterium]|nr:cytochrome c [Terriglobia bacterium]
MRKKISKLAMVRFLLSALVAWIAFSVWSRGLSQDQTPKVHITRSAAKQTHEVSGAKLYVSYCASCHGRDGKGDGPAAPALKGAPTDLTLLASNNGGKFPADHVMHVLSSEAEVTVHGSKEMPVWGPIFRRLSPDQNLGVLRANNVTNYLKSIQAK